MAADTRRGVVWVLTAASASGGPSLPSRYLIGGLMIPPHSKKASHSNQSCTHSMNPTINSTTNL